MSADDNNSDRRGSPRRWVMLRVLVDDQESVQFGNTINVSNSGMLIERIPEVDLQPDQVVSVVVQGMLAGDKESPDESRSMMVVRVDEAGYAVREGSQVEIGGNDRYVSMCRKHFKKKFYG